MLTDAFHPDEARADHESAETTYTLRVTVPDMARQGVVDVLSMRSLVRACRHAFLQPQQEEFERALAKMININGAMAQAIERGRTKRD